MGANENLMTVLTDLIGRGSATGPELAEKLGVNRRMVRNYIATLKAAGFPIAATGGRESRYVLSAEHPLGGFRLSPEELEALNAALIHLKLEKGYLYEDQYARVLNRIKRQTRVISEPPGIPATERIAEDPIRSRTKRWIEIICTGIHENRKMRMMYPASDDGAPCERIICPFSFHSADNENYLLAHCERRNDVREFNIKRILHLELLEAYFPGSMRSAIRNHFDHSIGAFGGTPFKVKLLVRAPFARVVQERILVKNQRTTPQRDGSVIYEAKLAGRPDVVRWVLSMGATCEVLEPLDLRDEVRDVLSRAWGQY